MSYPTSTFDSLGAQQLPDNEGVNAYDYKLQELYEGEEAYYDLEKDCYIQEEDIYDFLEQLDNNRLLEIIGAISSHHLSEALEGTDIRKQYV